MVAYPATPEFERLRQKDCYEFEDRLISEGVSGQPRLHNKNVSKITLSQTLATDSIPQ